MFSVVDIRVIDARRSRQGATIAGTAFLAAMTAFQVASGLHPRSVPLVGVVVLLMVGCAVSFTAAVTSPRSAVVAFCAAVAIGFAAEWIGIRTGFPFGDYRYTGLLWPQVGGVPILVALAWAGMGPAAYAVAPGEGPVRILSGAAALTAWDLFLDPQMLRLGAWTWAEAGPYRGVPLSNFAGWLLVSALLMAVIHAVTGRRAAGATGLVCLYTVMAVMETIGFAAVFDPPDPFVAAVGGVSMGIFAVTAWTRRRRREASDG